MYSNIKIKSTPTIFLLTGDLSIACLLSRPPSGVNQNNIYISILKSELEIISFRTFLFLPAFFLKSLSNRNEKLDNWKVQLPNRKVQLADAKVQLADAKVQLADGKVRLADAKVQLADGKVQLADGKVQLDSVSQKNRDNINHFPNNQVNTINK